MKVDSVQLLSNGWGMPPLPEATASALLDAVLSGQETLQLETKRVSGKMVGKAMQTICAFANSHGGWLMLGVEDFDKATGRSPAWHSREPGSH